MIGKQWRVYAIIGISAAVASLIGLAVLVAGVNEMLDGELGEIIDRVSSPGFDPGSADNEAYFESLDVTLTANAVLLFAIGAVLVWIISLLQYAAVARVAIFDLRGRRVTTVTALRGTASRMLRLTGLTIQIVLAYSLAALVMVLLALVAPPTLILTVPLFLLAVLASIVVLVVAFTAAAIGPRVAPLPYAVRLIRGVYWATVGRVLIIALIAMAAGFAVNLLTSVVSLIIWWAGLIFSTVAAPIQVIIQTVATVVIYEDLDGETGPDITSELEAAEE